jgi:pimeloyl-ACP methyl ester carboxylesterase
MQGEREVAALVSRASGDMPGDRIGSVRRMEVDTVIVRDSEGRSLGIAAADIRAGFPLLLHSGSPGSRVLYQPAVELAAEYGFRMVSYDRPGYGLSDPRPGRLVADAVEDALVIADELGFQRFATWGFSGGGPFALACAARLGDHVSAACVFASLGPSDAPDLDFLTGRSKEFRAEVKLFTDNRQQAREKYRADAAGQLESMSDAATWISFWGERAGVDDAHSQRLAHHLAASTREAARQGDEGWWEDWVAFLSPWGIDLAGIDVPVQLWHGEKDLAAPIEHGRWLADHIPGVDAHLLPEDDHSTIESEIVHQRAAFQWLRDHSK